MSAHPPLRIFLFLVLGVWAMSTAVIWIRLSDTPPMALSAWRLILAVVFLSPMFFRAWSNADDQVKRRVFTLTFLPGLALAAHFILWTVGARLTVAANATLIVNMAPIAMPFMLWMVLRERVRKMEIAGTFVALAGVMILFGPSFRLGPDGFRGEIICFISMLTFAVYLALGRRNRTSGSLWLYLIPVYAWAAVLCFATALIMEPAPFLPRRGEWIWLLLLAVVPTIIGHGLLNYVLRNLGGQPVSVANQGQFIFAAPMAYFLFREAPGLVFYPAALLIVLGCWLATLRRTQPPIAKS